MIQRPCVSNGLFNQRGREIQTMLTKHLTRLFQHMSWANQQILEILEQHESTLGDALKLMAHITAAEYIWFSRIKGEDVGDMTPWTPMSLAQCRELSDKNGSGYLALLEGMTDKDLQSEITYRTTRGDEFSSNVADILLHVTLHGSHHRGQIASILRAELDTARAMDFIVYSLQNPSPPQP